MNHFKSSRSWVYFPHFKSDSFCFFFFFFSKCHTICLVQWMFNSVLLLPPPHRLTFPPSLPLPLCLLLSFCVAYQCAVLNLSVNKACCFWVWLSEGINITLMNNLPYSYVTIKILPVIIDTMMIWNMLTNCSWKVSEHITNS